MSDIKLFRITPSGVQELEGRSMSMEKSLQTLIERHLEVFLGVRFLATEYSTGRSHAGRIDTLGIDENGCPVIIEYKRATNENVINLGLFYLDWLLDHKAEFDLLVMRRLGDEVAKQIEWSSPRLLCIAGDFTKYDEYAVQQINRNIELLRYRLYGNELLLFELVNSTAANNSGSNSGGSVTVVPGESQAVRSLERASTQLKDLYEALKSYLLALGDDVEVKTLKHYFAFKRIKNFASVEVHQGTGVLLVFVKVDPDTVVLEPGFSRDMKKIGHLETGDLEITLRSVEDLEKAKPLILRSYEVS